MRKEQMQAMYVNTTLMDGVEVPVITQEIEELFRNANGRMAYPLTNDRAFRGVVSYSERVRRRLAAILLALPEKEITSSVILNPVNFGQAFDEKLTQEDVRLLVNGNTILDIELQNLYLRSNKKRFLLYLCRNFDSIRSGGDYNELKASLFVGIMNYNFGEEAPEFFSQYRIMNKKTGRPLFTEDNYFGVNVINLKETELADDNDRSSGRTLLADLFRADTWEQLRELAGRSSFAKEVAFIMCASNADIRERIALDGARRYDEVMATIRAEAEETKKEIALAKEEETRARENAAKARENEAKARENEAKAKEGEARAREAEAIQKQRADALERELLELKAKFGQE